MPLLDHFRPPLSQTHPGRGFHGAWAAAITRPLNAEVLPAGYYAVPFLDRDGPVEIDVAAGEFDPAGSPVAAPPWTPAVPGLAVAVEWPASDEVRVEIFADDGDPRLAAVEFVSPRNKDRPRSRAAFATKCADYLRKGCGPVVVDTVTSRRADLPADLLGALGTADSGPASTTNLAAVSYRAVGRDEGGQLLAWPAAREVSWPLLTLPLWLGADPAVPLDLEASHLAACADLRIRQAG